ncbi:hypothetical protein THAOC_15482 [Thalassiosira oceanica]|uniref:Uncharacterized protein n=1 Tax=Thalassiosira oceanica TaxID=159749 RepID=K0SFQ1_THAOC|nr:hypothetical protein THAOC_15482 [Thalassiosira oceanica]|eukprot:EJK63839.1 hypothetical protein THAOC_15482 [Thalassiosira oceanica]
MHAAVPDRKFNILTRPKHNPPSHFCSISTTERQRRIDHAGGPVASRGMDGWEGQRRRGKGPPDGHADKILNGTMGLMNQGGHLLRSLRESQESSLRLIDRHQTLTCGSQSLCA